MDTTKPLLSGTAATVVGAVAAVLAAVSPFVPSPWNTLMLILAFVGAALAGVAAVPPKLTDGKPLLQGTFLTVASGALTLLTQVWDIIPHGWPQSIALGVAALLAWLSGRALPALGTKAPAPAPAPEAAPEPAPEKPADPA